MIRSSWCTACSEGKMLHLDVLEFQMRLLTALGCVRLAALGSIAFYSFEVFVDIFDEWVCVASMHFEDQEGCFHSGHASQSAVMWL